MKRKRTKKTIKLPAPLKQTKRTQIKSRIHLEQAKYTCVACGETCPDVYLKAIPLGDSCFDVLCEYCYPNQLTNKQTIEAKKEQLDGMLLWRKQIEKEKKHELSKAIEYYHEKSLKYHVHLSPSAIKKIKKLIQTYGLTKFMDAFDIGYDTYITLDVPKNEKEKDKTLEQWNLSFDKLGGILYNQNLPEYMKKIAHIKNLAKNKLQYCNPHKLGVALREFHEQGYPLDEIKESLLNDEYKNWTRLMTYLGEHIQNSFTDNY